LSYFNKAFIFTTYTTPTPNYANLLVNNSLNEGCWMLDVFNVDLGCLS
jgi:hypothetical protein